VKTFEKQYQLVKNSTSLEWAAFVRLLDSESGSTGECCNSCREKTHTLPRWNGILMTWHNHEHMIFCIADADGMRLMAAAMLDLECVVAGVDTT